MAFLQNEMLIYSYISITYSNCRVAKVPYPLFNTDPKKRFKTPRESDYSSAACFLVDLGR